MKRKNIKAGLGALTASLLMAALFAGCTAKFEEYNTHPYRPYISDQSSISNIERIMMTAHENESQMIDQMIGADYGGYFAMGNNWNGTNFTTYNPANDWINYPFNTIMTGFYGNFFIIESQTEKTGPVYALAKIIRVITMLKLTDMYGPIPYTQMGSGGFVTPYDSQEDVYKTMLQEMDESITELTSYVNATGNQKPLGDFDLIYKGDFTQWIKLANSIRLRMAIRIGDVASALAQETASAAINHQMGVLKANSDNAFIPLSVQNPYWKAAWSWNDLRGNASLIAYMNGYADPRLQHYYTRATDYGNNFVGIRSGLNMTSAQQTNYRKLSGPNFSETQPMAVMYASEAAFLMAEAKLKWNIGAESVQTLYEKGITLSFEQYGVSSSLSGYVSNNTLAPAAYTDPVVSGNSVTAPLSTVTVKWDDAASAAVKLERLIIQKWIAMYPLGFEAWCDYRRTGYPKMYPVVSNLSPASTPVITARGARRIKFPPSEYQSNPTNIQQAVQLLGGIDSQGTDLWWAKKN